MIYTNYLTLLTLAVFYSGCGLRSDDSLRGVEKRSLSNLGTKPSFENPDSLTGNSIFPFEDQSTPENKCSEEHSKTIFN